MSDLFHQHSTSILRVHPNPYSFEVRRFLNSCPCSIPRGGGIRTAIKCYINESLSNAAEKNLQTKVLIETRKKKNVAAAFFDVDGTITRTNVVAAYFSGRVKEIPAYARVIWVPWFALSCVLYLIVDQIDRTSFNHLFYSVFKGHPAFYKRKIAKTVYQDYYRPRIYGGALKLIRNLKQKGYHIVLVTGCLDFLITPLAQELGADFTYASKLVEDQDGKFTGRIKGAGANETAKAKFVRRYAAEHGICLSSSFAFGDSIADLGLLESVGSPHAVNPDNQLVDIAASRQWPIISWKLEDEGEPTPFAFGWLTAIFRSGISKMLRARRRQYQWSL